MQRLIQEFNDKFLRFPPTPAKIKTFLTNNDIKEELEFLEKTNFKFSNDFLKELNLERKVTKTKTAKTVKKIEK